MLVRGRQLDGPGELGFNDPVSRELVLNGGDYEGQPAQATWTTVFVAQRSPG